MKAMENNITSSTEPAGKTALVTGGTKGTGRAIAEQLARAWATVVITTRHPPEYLHFIAADLTKPADVARAVADIRQPTKELIFSSTTWVGRVKYVAALIDQQQGEIGSETSHSRK